METNPSILIVEDDTTIAMGLVTALEAELSFFSQILGIEPAGNLPKLELA